MKKVLFYSALLALATSCAENELDSFSAPEAVKKGITFVAEQADTRMQWDATVEGSTTYYDPFWYAEKDRIGILPVGVLNNNGDKVPSTYVNSWFGLGTTATTPTYIYKATKSAASGEFTSTKDDQTLSFDGDKNAHFLAVYPATVKGATKSASDSTIVLTALPALAEQNLTTTKGQNDATLMYSLSQATRDNDWDAVGEKAGLFFNKPLSALVLKTKNLDAYAEDFGILKSITVTAKGYDADKDGTLDEGDIAASKLTYDATRASLEVNPLDPSKSTLVHGTSPTEVSVIKLGVGTQSGSASSYTYAGLEWSDDALAVVVLKDSIKRAAFSAEKPETMEMKYEFANITLVQSIPTYSNWDGYITCPELDIDSFDYLVVGTSNNRTLIVNGGDFAEMFGTTGVIWPAGSTTEIAYSNFSKIICNVNVDNKDDMLLLNKFTEATSIELAENTEIFEGGLNISATGLADLTTIKLPKVTTVSATAFNRGASTSAALANVEMPAYNFAANNAITSNILKANALVTLDMSAVESMKAAFPNDGFALSGFTSLVTVTVQDGVKLGAGSFSGCTSLTTIAGGAVDITNGTSAFEGCVATNFTSVRINGTVIPANAFKGATYLTKVVTDEDGEVLAEPTKIGNSAFEGTAIVNIDLSSVTDLGENAFKDVTELVGIENEAKGINVLTVGAATIKANAFNGCTGLNYVEFKNATTFYDGVLSGASGLVEVKFAKVFAMATAGDPAVGVATTAFMPASKTIFLNQEQSTSYYDGTNFYPNGDKGSANAVTIACTKIVLE